MDIPLKMIKKVKKVSFSEFRVTLSDGIQHTFELVETFPDDWIFAIKLIHKEYRKKNREYKKMMMYINC